MSHECKDWSVPAGWNYEFGGFWMLCTDERTYNLGPNPGGQSDAPFTCDVMDAEGTDFIEGKEFYSVEDALAFMRVISKQSGKTDDAYILVAMDPEGQWDESLIASGEFSGSRDACIQMAYQDRTHAKKFAEQRYGIVGPDGQTEDITDKLDDLWREVSQMCGIQTPREILERLVAMADEMGDSSANWDWYEFLKLVGDARSTLQNYPQGFDAEGVARAGN